jgi:hypothetical protein
VGLVAVTRKGGCTSGGQRQPTLYRVTDRECYDIPAKLLDAMKETNEWKRATSVQKAVELIEAAERAVRKEPTQKIHLGHAVLTTVSPRALVGPKTRAPSDPWNDGPGHGVTMAEEGSNPVGMRVTAEFLREGEKANHRAPHMPPLYVAIPTPIYGCTHHDNRHHWLTQNQIGYIASLTKISQSLTY